MGESLKIRICKECRTRFFFSHEIIGHMQQTGHRNIAAFDSQNFDTSHTGEPAYNLAVFNQTTRKIPDNTNVEQIAKQAAETKASNKKEDKQNGSKAINTYHPTLDSLQKTTAVLMQFEA